MGREARHNAVVRAQTLVSVAIYAVLPTTVLWLIQAPGPATLFGNMGMIGPLLAPAAIGTFMMTIGLTLMIRGAVRAGTMPALNASPADRSVLGILPASLPLRAALLALVATVIFVPAGLAVVTAAGLLPLSRVGFAVFNIVYGSCIGAAMTPSVVLAALADRT